VYEYVELSWNKREFCIVYWIVIYFSDLHGTSVLECMLTCDEAYMK